MSSVKNGDGGIVVTHLGCQANYLSPSFHPQVHAHNATNSYAQHLALVVQQYCHVVIELHIPSVRLLHRLLTPHNDSASHVAVSYLERIWDSLLACTPALGPVPGPEDMGRAHFTMQTTSSPMLPKLLLTLFLSTLTHSTSSAPELSMTYCFVFFWLENERYVKMAHDTYI